MQIKVLKYGQLSFTGHTIFVDRNKDVYNVATTLPRLPSQTTILLLQRKGKTGKTKTLKCRRDKVQKALEWLKNHSPAYADVVISNEILNSLPEDGYLGDLGDAGVDSTEIPEEDGNTDEGPAIAQGRPSVEPVDEIEEHSGMVSGSTTANMNP